MDEEARSFLPKTTFTRREFVITTLAAGFALAVRPVSAQTITTDADGLEAGEVKIPVTDGTIPAYRAMPATGGPFPVVLVVQEIFGVHGTSKICAVASPSWGIWLLRLNCTPARVMSRS